MYAIVQCKGVQYRVVPDQVIQIPRTEAEPGSTLTLDQVLFVQDGTESRVGTPLVENATVEAEVLGHVRGKKVVVGKYKRRKDYRRKKGHRQDFTEVRIRSIAG